MIFVAWPAAAAGASQFGTLFANPPSKGAGCTHAHTPADHGFYPDGRRCDVAQGRPQLQGHAHAAGRCQTQDAAPRPLRWGSAIPWRRDLGMPQAKTSPMDKAPMPITSIPQPFAHRLM